MPGHFKCCVKYCNNTPTSKYPDGTVSFHRFPKNNSVKLAWIDYCSHSKEWVPTDFSRICSEHFDKSDYETNLQEFLLNVKSRRMLRKNVIPTKTAGLSTRIWHESVFDNSNIIFQEAPAVPLKMETCWQESAHMSDCLPTTDDEDSQPPITCIQQPLEEQEKLTEPLKLCNNSLVQQKSEDIKKIEHLEKIIEQQKLQLSRSILYTDLNHKIKEILSGILSPAQLDLVLKLKKKVKWSKEDLSKAITLRYFSKRAYLFLQKENFPLPSIRTLQMYCGKINLNSGILTDVLKFMHIGADFMQRRERAVVLLFDKMKVSSLYEYNKHNDEVVGPHNHVQIVMARSLFGNWKQPVYIGFDQNMNTTLLMEIIVALHAASFEVVAVVGDWGLSNLGTLGIDVNQVHFQHPATEGKIFCFPDSPHLLKLIRNWLLHTGFLLSNGVSITKNLLKDMIYKTDKSEINSSLKVTERHLNCTDNADKQNVKLACQLLSHPTAIALRMYCSSIESESLANFIQLVNDWFDIMNSRNFKEVTLYKKPYENTVKQNEKLDEMYHMIQMSRCIGKINLQVFQKSILISIKSLRGLFKEMQEKFQISFILTSKLNQDALESLFGILRTRGGLDDHPSPIDLHYRLRMVLLGKTPGIVHSQTNILPYQQDEITLTTSLLEKAEIEPLLPPHIHEEDDEDMDFGTSTSLDSTSTQSSANYIEKDGVEYLSGWLARNFSKSYPELSNVPYMLKHDDHCYSKPSWVKLSYGGLTEPSSKLKRSIEILERHFKKINKGTFATKKNILNKLMNVLKRKVEIPEIVTKAFLKQRIFIRINRLNNKKIQKKLLGKI